MKKIILTFIFTFFVLTVSSIAKERFFITGFVGYTFSDNIYMSENYTGSINDGVHFGGSFEFLLKNIYGFELSYQYQSTDAEIYNGYDHYSTNMGVSYIMAGGMRYQPILEGKLLPYVGLNLGAGIVSPDGFSSRTRFAWGAKLGIKIRATHFLAFRLQAQLNSIVNGIDGSSMWITPAGASLALDSYSSLYQIGFTGGVSFAF